MLNSIRVSYHNLLITLFIFLYHQIKNEKDGKIIYNQPSEIEIEKFYSDFETTLDSKIKEIVQRSLDTQIREFMTNIGIYSAVT
jgi:hypothetical protein